MASPNRLSRREKSLLYILLCLAIAMGMIVLLILPAVRQSNQLQESIETLEMQKMELERKKNALDKNLARISELDAECDRLYGKLLLNTVNEEELDRLVTEIALSCGVTPKSLSLGDRNFVPALPFGGGEEEGEYAGLLTAGISINGECDYGHFIDLLNAFYGRSELLVASASYMEPKKADEPGSFQIDVEFYLLPPQGTPVSTIGQAAGV